MSKKAEEQYGGGNLNPGLYTNPNSIERFQDLKVGLSVHWGPSSLGGKEIGWSRGKQIPVEEYDAFYQSFNPVRFDANEWIKLVKDWGMHYIIITSKHHDGFALWHSKVTDYNISNTPFKRDIVRELSDASRAHGIVFGSYYSLIDWYHPDYLPAGHGGAGPLIKLPEGEEPNFERYLSFMKAQLKELVHEYGAEIIQFDGEWDPGWTHIVGSDLYLYVRWLNDKVLINSRAGKGREDLDENGHWKRDIYPGDFEERERMVDWVEDQKELNENHFKKGNAPWQAWVTIDTAQWAYNENPNLLSPKEIMIDLLKTVGDGGNYLMNVGPRPDGSFHPEQVEILKEVGTWLQKYGEGIYGSRGGKYAREGHYTTTQKEGAIYLYMYNKENKVVELLDKQFKDAKVFTSRGTQVASTFEEGKLSFITSFDEGEDIAVYKIVKA